MYTTLLLLISATLQFSVRLVKSPQFLQFGLLVQIGKTPAILAIDSTDPYTVLYNSTASTFQETSLPIVPRVLLARQEEDGPIMRDQFVLDDKRIESTFTLLRQTSPFNGITGVLGLGPSMSSKTILESMQTQSLIPSLRFGYHIDPSTEFATLEFGSFSKELDYVNLVKLNWTSIINSTINFAPIRVPPGLAVQFVAFGDYKSTQPMIGYVHTNVLLTHLPRSIFDAIAMQLSLRPSRAAFYDIDCRLNHPTLSVQFQGVVLTWNPEDYILKRTDGSCFVVFTPYVRPIVRNSLILGTGLMKKYYIGFDYTLDRIGFAVLAKAGEPRVTSPTQATSTPTLSSKALSNAPLLTLLSLFAL